MNGLQIFEFQVAGSHSSSNSNLLRGEFGRVLKPYKVKTTSPLRAPSPQQTQPNKELAEENENFDRHEVVCPDERAFYELCMSEGSQLRGLLQFLPAFYGHTTVCTGGRPTQYLVLEDLTARCGLPCVADLKMGVSRHYPGKPIRKLLADKEKYPSLRDAGWCIAGLLQHAPHGALLDKFGPSTGRAFSTQQVHARMTTFIGGERGSAKRRELVCGIASDLEEIQKWFGSQRRFWFRSSSILVVYNAEYFFEPHLQKCQNNSEPKLDVERSVSPKKNADIDQALLDAQLTSRSLQKTNEVNDVTLLQKQSDSDVSNSSSTRYIDIYHSEDETLGNSVVSQRNADTDKCGGIEPKSRPTKGDESLEAHVKAPISVCKSTIPEGTMKPGISPTSEMTNKTEKADVSCVSRTSENNAQRRPELEELADQSLESPPKKMKVELSPDSNSKSNENIAANSNSGPLIVRVKMIDFAHVLDAGGEPDRGYITGVSNLLQFIKSIA